MFARLRALFWQGPSKATRRCRPAVEALEDRTVPVTLSSVGSALFTSGFGVPNAALGTLSFVPTTATFGLTSFSGPSAFLPGFPLPGVNIGLATPFVGQTTPTFGATPFGFGGTGAGVGLATPTALQSTAAAQLTAAGMGLGIPGFGISSVPFGPGATGFSATSGFGFNTSAAELSTLAAGLGLPGTGLGPTTALDPFFLANAAQVAQQQIALDVQMAQQAFNNQIQALGTALSSFDNQTLAALQPLLLQQGLTAPVAGAFVFPNVQALTGASGTNLANVFAAESVAQHLAEVQLLEGELTGGSIFTAKLGAASTLVGAVNTALTVALNTQAALLNAPGALAAATTFNLPLALQLLQQQLPPS
jgi:hypothetical protein